tara:strand:+ start:203 stop:1555 length:1353 start_codon:yes stop_codon:yes gene_type:complete
MTTYTVTVQGTAGGNKYFIDGVQEATVSLIINNSYTFNQDDATNDTHPLNLSETSDGTHGGGSVYTTNVVYKGDGSSVSAATYASNFDSYTTRSVTISVVATTPSLFYYCSNHSGMGGSANVVSPLEGWSRQGWGDGAWSEFAPVSLTGLSMASALGTESVSIDVVATASTLSMTSALGTAVGEPEHVISVTGVSFETQLSGALAIEEGTGVVLGSLSTSFGIGTETAAGSVDAGWGRAEWGSFEWNANIDFITNVEGVTMSTTLGTPTVEVGTGVIATPSGVSMASNTGLLQGAGVALVEANTLTMSMALSGATVSGEGSVAVIAPSDQLDFAIGTPVIDIFTQVDSPSVSIASTTGTVSITGQAGFATTPVTMSSALGSASIEVGTGVVVNLTGLSTSFASGAASTTGGAIVNVSGVSLSVVEGNVFSTPWANVVTGASNTWTEVDAA